jgi:UDP-glucose:(heptosyl)LPS alpha-1,3-glucosyltransferase
VFAPVAFPVRSNILRRVKIAINHTRFARNGGIERYVFALAQRLLAEGHEVHVFARRWEPLEHPRLVFHRVPVLPLGEGMKALTFAYASAALIRRERFDVVHGFSKTFRQDVYTDGSGCFDDYLVYLRSASPWRRITTYRPLLAFAARHVERLRYRREPRPRVLAMSRRTLEQAVERHGFPRDRIEVLHGAVDDREFHPDRRRNVRPEMRRQLRTPEGAIVLLLLGNDYRRKGVSATIEALEKLGGSGRVLWVAGRDKRVARYEAEARARGVDARFLGPHPSPADCLAAADIFLFPSRYDVFGNAALEAMASGLPAIVSARAGVSEIIEDGVDGLILEDPDDPSEIARRVEALLDPGARAAMASRARAKAEQFALEPHFQRVFQVYEDIAAGPSARAPGVCRLFFGRPDDARAAAP